GLLCGRVEYLAHPSLPTVKLGTIQDRLSWGQDGDRYSRLKGPEVVSKTCPQGETRSDETKGSYWPNILVAIRAGYEAYAYVFNGLETLANAEPRSRVPAP